MTVTRKISALNEAQKAFILASIDYLLEFPSTPEQLHETIKNLQTCLAKPDSPNMPDDIKQLCQFIRAPQDSLYRLDQQNKEAITIADTKVYLIELITQHIQKAESDAQTKTTWNPTLIIEKYITESDKETILTSQNKKLNDPATIWEQRAHNPEKVYSFDIQFDEDNRQVIASLTARLPDQTEKYRTLTLTNVPRVYFLDAACIFLIAHNIEMLCISWSIRHIDDYLLNKGITCYPIPEVNATSYAAELLTDKDFLSFLIDEKVRLYSLLNTNGEAFNNIIKPGVKKLIKQGILRFTSAQTLLPEEATLANHPTYTPLLLNRTINLDSITSLRCRFLTLPSISQLVASNKLSINTALNLPIYLKPLFIKHEFINYFSTQHIDWQEWMSINRNIAKKLEDPGMMLLVTQSIISIHELTSLTELHFECLREKSIQKLLLNGELSFASFKRSSRNALERLITHNRCLFFSSTTEKTSNPPQSINQAKM